MNGNPAPFTVTVNTTGPSSGAVPISYSPPVLPQVTRVLPALAGEFLLFWFVFAVVWARRHSPRTRCLALGLPCAALLLLALVAAGCGGGSQGKTPPPPVVTPPGSFNLTVTPSANAANGKPLQLPTIPLTLTVN